MLRSFALYRISSRGLGRSCSVARLISSSPTTGSTANKASTSSSPTATAADLAALQAEIQRLQQTVQDANAQQTRNLELLAQQVDAQPQAVEQHLVERIHSKLGASPLDQISAATRDYFQHNATFNKLLEQMYKQANRHPNLINRYTVGGLLLSLVVVWRYWASIQKRTSQEVADIASKTLEQENLRQSIQETIDALAHSPETLEALTQLLQSLIQDPATQQHLVHLIVYAAQTEQVQTALLEILQNVFQDPHLQELGGEFLLKGLGVESVKQMLDEQTQGLVKRTVSDESVQRATGDGVRKSLGYAFNPFR